MTMTPTPPAARCDCGPEFVTGVQIVGEYDGVLYHECMQCRVRWHRWKEGTWQHGKAKRFVERTHA